MVYGYLVGFGYMIVLLVVSELLTRLTRIPREIIRKVLHMMIGFEYLVLYHFFGASWQIVIIPATFVVLNTLSYRLRFLHSIVRDQGEHAGIIYYAVSITALSVVCACIPEFLYPFGVGVFCLSFGDCAAALAGKYLHPHVKLLGDKTLWGFLFCFVFSFLSQLLLAWITKHPLTWDNMLLIALIAAGCEISIGHGLDNIAVPVWCALFAYGFYFTPSLLPLFALIFSGYLLFALTYTSGAFTLPASVLACLLLIAIGDLGGWGAFTIVLSSYALIFVVDKVADHIRTKRTGVRAYHRPRTIVQVIQNGLPALLALIGYRFLAHPAWIAAYAVAIGESLVDSISSDVGVLSKRSPVDIISHKPVEAGKSGGISLLGTLSGSLGSLLTPILLGFFFGWHWSVALVFVWPILGMLLDSVLGSTLQVRYRCQVCGAVTDSPIHCGRPAQKYGGLPHFSNGQVNLVINLLATATYLGVGYLICL